MLAKRFAVDEVVVDALDLARPALARGHRDRQDEVRLLLGRSKRGERRLARARRRGEHEHQAPRAATVGRPRIAAHSRFWTCSRSWSTTAFSSRPIAVSARSYALEQSVLTSRLNSCARKSSRRPTAPAFGDQIAGGGDMASSRSSSSRMSALVASSTASWCRRSGLSAGAASRSARPARRAARGSPPACAPARLRPRASGAAISSRRSCEQPRRSPLPSRGRAWRPGRRAPCRSPARIAGVERGSRLGVIGCLDRFDHAADRRGCRRASAAATSLRSPIRSIAAITLGQHLLVDRTRRSAARVAPDGQGRLDVAAGQACAATRSRADRLEVLEAGRQAKPDSRPLPLTLLSSQVQRIAAAGAVGAGKAGHAAECHGCPAIRRIRDAGQTAGRADRTCCGGCVRAAALNSGVGGAAGRPAAGHRRRRRLAPPRRCRRGAGSAVVRPLLA